VIGVGVGVDDVLDADAVLGGSARQTPRALPCCMPSATANSQPMPGLIPW
jgi:hypothetical protein